MSEKTSVTELLRPGLLAGVSVLLAGPGPAQGPGRSAGAAAGAACAELGARVAVCELAGEGALLVEEEAVDRAVAGSLGESGVLDLLVVDGAALFAAAGPGAGAPADGSEGSRAALRGALEAAWSVTRAVVNLAFLPRTLKGTPCRAQAGDRGGRIVYLAPAPDAGEHAEAAGAGLENLARTLSVEWARHGITIVTIAPGPATTTGEMATLVAYLASPAGAYFSGCLLDLRGPGGPVQPQPDIPPNRPPVT
jgi:NAD(P)-dependent dehydrogenase (short-subunit alcohol dehydrogenase family)